MRNKVVGIIFIATLITSLSLIWDISPTESQVRPVATSAPSTLFRDENYIRSDRLGITFISSADTINSSERYRNALILGAGWNRWPLYWNNIETSPFFFEWDAYDRLVVDDVRNGIQINAILLGRPQFHADGARIVGLNEPIYADGTDTPGDLKELNPNNAWANFVRQAVLRYMPGGILAQQQGWVNDEGIKVWEVWNEPDHPPFWNGTFQDYARLLKIAYIVAHEADPDTTVMFGGLLFSTEVNWLAQVLNIFQDDGFRERYNWYMDAVAVHSYGNPWRSGWLTLVARQTFIEYDIMRPIWLNETGVPVWDDYPGPVWLINEADRPSRATTDQQAWYFIQSTVLAWTEGADKVFFHQLYDDCGDQPAGTNFPPHSGELCVGDATCFGDAFGIYRNPNDAVCYSQHPFANSPRPIASAFRLMSEVFGREDFVRDDVDLLDNGGVVVRFERPNTDEVIKVIWNRTYESISLELDAEGTEAQLFTLQGNSRIAPNEGIYRLQLASAESYNFTDIEPEQISAIGGEPIILIESVTGGLDDPNDTSIETQGASGTPNAPVIPTPGTVLVPIATPTIDPSTDTTPPTVTVQALPAVSGATFDVAWQGEDNVGIDRYFVWVRVNEGEWSPWLETAGDEWDVYRRGRQCLRFCGVGGGCSWQLVD